MPYSIYLNHETNEMVMVLHHKVKDIPSYFKFEDDNHIEKIVSRYRYNQFLFVSDALLDDPTELPDYINNLDFEDFTHYYFGGYQDN